MEGVSIWTEADEQQLRRLRLPPPFPPVWEGRGEAEEGDKEKTRRARREVRAPGFDGSRGLFRSDSCASANRASPGSRGESSAQGQAHSRLLTATGQECLLMGGRKTSPLASRNSFVLLFAFFNWPAWLVKLRGPLIRHEAKLSAGDSKEPPGLARAGCVPRGSHASPPCERRVSGLGSRAGRLRKGLPRFHVARTSLENASYLEASSGGGGE